MFQKYKSLFDLIINPINSLLEFLSTKTERFISEDFIQLVFSSSNFILFIVISQFRPAFMNGLLTYHPNFFLAGINLTWQFCQIITTVFVFVGFLKKGSINYFSATYFLALGFLFVPTILYNLSIVRFLSMIVISITFIFLFEILKSTNGISTLIKNVYYYHGVLIILNYISVLVFPESFYTDYRGMSVFWLFGNYQQNFNWFVVFISTSGFMRKQQDFKDKANFNFWFNIVTYIAMILTTVTVWSAVTLVALFLTLFLILTTKRYEWIANAANGISAFIASLFVSFGFALFDIQVYFSFIIEKILRKRLDFSGRSKIWDKAFSYIKERPLLGNGIENSSQSFSKIGKPTAHNHYINTLYNGGIIYLIFTFILVVLSMEKVIKNIKNSYAKYLSASLSGYFVYFIAEAKISIFVLMFLLLLGYYIDDVIVYKN